jgi:predicted nucleotidyltransferase
MLSENDISRLASRIMKGYRPLVVGVFGSYAIGAPRDASDLDMFVIKQTVEPPRERERTVRRLCFDVLYSLDIHVFTPDEFEETAYEEMAFPWVIVQQARLYAWSNAAAELVPSLTRAKRV